MDAGALIKKLDDSSLKQVTSSGNVFISNSGQLLSYVNGRYTPLKLNINKDIMLPLYILDVKTPIINIYNSSVDMITNITRFFENIDLKDGYLTTIKNLFSDVVSTKKFNDLILQGDFLPITDDFHYNTFDICGCWDGSIPHISSKEMIDFIPVKDNIIYNYDIDRSGTDIRSLFMYLDFKDGITIPRIQTPNALTLSPLFLPTLSRIMYKIGNLNAFTNQDIQPYIDRNDLNLRNYTIGIRNLRNAIKALPRYTGVNPKNVFYLDIADLHTIPNYITLINIGGQTYIQDINLEPIPPLTLFSYNETSISYNDLLSFMEGIFVPKHNVKLNEEDITMDNNITYHRIGANKKYYNVKIDKTATPPKNNITIERKIEIAIELGCVKLPKFDTRYNKKSIYINYNYNYLYLLQRIGLLRDLYINNLKNVITDITQNGIEYNINYNQNYIAVIELNDTYISLVNFLSFLSFDAKFNIYYDIKRPSFNKINLKQDLINIRYFDDNLAPDLLITYDNNDYIFKLSKTQKQYFFENNIYGHTTSLNPSYPSYYKDCYYELLTDYISAKYSNLYNRYYTIKIPNKITIINDFLGDLMVYINNEIATPTSYTSTTLKSLIADPLCIRRFFSIDSIIDKTKIIESLPRQVLLHYLVQDNFIDGYQFFHIGERTVNNIMYKNFNTNPIPFFNSLIIYESVNNPVFNYGYFNDDPTKDKLAKFSNVWWVIYNYLNYINTGIFTFPTPEYEGLVSLINYIRDKKAQSHIKNNKYVELTTGTDENKYPTCDILLDPYSSSTMLDYNEYLKNFMNDINNLLGDVNSLNIEENQYEEVLNNPKYKIGQTNIREWFYVNYVASQKENYNILKFLEILLLSLYTINQQIGYSLYDKTLGYISDGYKNKAFQIKNAPIIVNNIIEPLKKKYKNIYKLVPIHSVTFITINSGPQGLTTHLKFYLNRLLIRFNIDNVSSSSLEDFVSLTTGDKMVNRGHVRNVKQVDSIAKLFKNSIVREILSIPENSKIIFIFVQNLMEKKLYVPNSLINILIKRSKLISNNPNIQQNVKVIKGRKILDTSSIETIVLNCKTCSVANGQIYINNLLSIENNTQNIKNYNVLTLLDVFKFSLFMEDELSAKEFSLMIENDFRSGCDNRIDFFSKFESLEDEHKTKLLNNSTFLFRCWNQFMLEKYMELGNTSRDYKIITERSCKYDDIEYYKYNYPTPEGYMPTFLDYCKCGNVEMIEYFLRQNEFDKEEGLNETIRNNSDICIIQKFIDYRTKVTSDALLEVSKIDLNDETEDIRILKEENKEKIWKLLFNAVIDTFISKNKILDSSEKIIEDIVKYIHNIDKLWYYATTYPAPYILKDLFKYYRNPEYKKLDGMISFGPNYSIEYRLPYNNIINSINSACQNGHTEIINHIVYQMLLFDVYNMYKYYNKIGATANVYDNIIGVNVTGYGPIQGGANTNIEFPIQFSNKNQMIVGEKSENIYTKKIGRNKLKFDDLITYNFDDNHYIDYNFINGKFKIDDMVQNSLNSDNTIKFLVDRYLDEDYISLDNMYKYYGTDTFKINAGMAGTNVDVKSNMVDVTLFDNESNYDNPYFITFADEKYDIINFNHNHSTNNDLYPNIPSYPTNSPGKGDVNADLASFVSPGSINKVAEEKYVKELKDKLLQNNGGTYTSYNKNRFSVLNIIKLMMNYTHMNTMFNHVVKKNNRNIVDFIISNFSRSISDNDAPHKQLFELNLGKPFIDVCWTGNIVLVKKLLDLSNSLESIFDKTKTIIDNKKNNSKILTYFQKEFDDNSLHIKDCILKNKITKQDKFAALIRSVNGGRMSVFTYILSDELFPDLREIYLETCKEGRVDMLNYLYNYRKPTKNVETECLARAAAFNRLDIIINLLERGVKDEYGILKKKYEGTLSYNIIEQLMATDYPTLLANLKELVTKKDLTDAQMIFSKAIILAINQKNLERVEELLKVVEKSNIINETMISNLVGTLYKRYIENKDKQGKKLLIVMMSKVLKFVIINSVYTNNVKILEYVMVSPLNYSSDSDITDLSDAVATLLNDSNNIVLDILREGQDYVFQLLKNYLLIEPDVDVGDKPINEVNKIKEYNDNVRLSALGIASVQITDTIKNVGLTKAKLVAGGMGGSVVYGLSGLTGLGLGVGAGIAGGVSTVAGFIPGAGMIAGAAGTTAGALGISAGVAGGISAIGGLAAGAAFLASGLLLSTPVLAFGGLYTAKKIYDMYANKTTTQMSEKLVNDLTKGKMMVVNLYTLMSTFRNSDASLINEIIDTAITAINIGISKINAGDNVDTSIFNYLSVIPLTLSYNSNNIGQSIKQKIYYNVYDRILRSKININSELLMNIITKMSNTPRTYKGGEQYTVNTHTPSNKTLMKNFLQFISFNSMNNKDTQITTDIAKKKITVL